MGPLGQPVTAAWARSGDTALVELAEASGIALVSPTRDSALNAGTHGTGELITHALDAGCTRIVLAVGGSSSTDGGAGMLTALGAGLLNDAGQPVPPGGLGLLEIDRIDLTGIDPRLRDAQVILASDVDNPLLGEVGAAAVYGPQKGAQPTEVALLDRALAHFRDRLAEAVGLSSRLPEGTTVEELALTAGAGAAGGTGFGALVVLGAQMRPGADYIMEIVGFADALEAADVVVTGEGRFDRQTLHGKGPGEVIDRAQAAGLPVWVVCGAAELTADDAPGVTGIIELRDLAPVETCLTDPAPVVEQAGARLAEQLQG
jgi:glycerate kinase